MASERTLSQRLRRLRLSQGWTLDELARHLGGLVTRQALSKYEIGLARPSPRVLAVLAETFSTKVLALLGDDEISVEFVGNQSTSSLGVRKRARVEARAETFLEQRVKVQRLTLPTSELAAPIQAYPVSVLEDSEHAANKVRADWGLAADPIASISASLERRLVHVCEIDGNDEFEGLAALGRDRAGDLIAAAVYAQLGLSGERQRLNIAQELGHLVMRLPLSTTREQVRFTETAKLRFGAAFLAPAQAVYDHFGRKRSTIQTEELLLFKRAYRVSIPVMIDRLRALDVITDRLYDSWRKTIVSLGWQQTEPEPIMPESPAWLRQNVLHALAESLITRDEALQLLPDLPSSEVTLSHPVDQAAFLRLPIAERRRIMEEQARTLAPEYEHDTTWRESLAYDVFE